MSPDIYSMQKNGEVLPQVRVFDSHAHYYDKKFDEIPGGADLLLSRLKECVSGIINVGTDCSNSLECVAQAQKYEFMYAAVGIHPTDAQNEKMSCPCDEAEKIYSLIASQEQRRKNKIVAIGEIGFDYYWEPVDKRLQSEYFSLQMQLAEKTGLPVIIHDREAHGDVFEMILKYPGVRGVIHSCSLSAEMAKDLARRGWFISFSGTLTFKNASRVREACRAVPTEKLLVETDAPYLAPHPYRGKMNNSSLMRYTVSALAEIHGIEPDEAARITEANARLLFGIE